MDRQAAFLVLVVLTMVWSASGAPPVDWADRNSEPEREAKTDGGSLTGCATSQSGSYILADEEILALVVNPESDALQAGGFTKHLGKVPVRVTINSRRHPAPREGP